MWEIGGSQSPINGVCGGKAAYVLEDFGAICLRKALILATFAPGVATIKYWATDTDTDYNVNVDAEDRANVDPIIDDADLEAGLVI